MNLPRIAAPATRTRARSWDRLKNATRMLASPYFTLVNADRESECAARHRHSAVWFAEGYSARVRCASRAVRVGDGTVRCTERVGRRRRRRETQEGQYRF